MKLLGKTAAIDLDQQEKALRFVVVIVAMTDHPATGHGVT